MASMKSFQALRSPAVPLTSFHDLPVFPISSSIVLRHVLFGLPLLLYPWGFQSNAVFSIAPASLRNVCPIQFLFLLFIWISVGICLVSMRRCTTFSSCISDILPQQCVSGRDGPPACPAHYPDLNTLQFYRWWHLKCAVDVLQKCAVDVLQKCAVDVLQKSATSGTWNSEYRMDCRWFIRGLEFSSESGDHSSDSQRPLLKPKLDTWVFSVIVRKPFLRRPVCVHKRVPLLSCGVDSQRDTFLQRGVISTAQPPSWRTTHCRLSATAYSIYSQLPSILKAVPATATWGRAMP